METSKSTKRQHHTASAMTPEAFVFACDPVLMPLLRANTEPLATQRLNHLLREFISPQITSTLTYELRRGASGGLSRVGADTDTFQELQSVARGNVLVRLHQIREALRQGSVQIPPIQDFAGYIKATARHAFVDYIRTRYPGRYSLDTGLRVALNTTASLALWKERIHPDFYEWRCGYRAWQEEGRNPLSLRKEAALRTRLWRELKQEEGTRAETLHRLFQISGSPLLYNDVLSFLAAFWDVEVPYRAATYEISAIRAPSLSATTQDPESIVQLLGILHEVWERLKPLSPIQRAVLLLHLPPTDNRNFLEEFVRHGIAQEEDIAEAIGLTLEELRFQYPLLPLEDADTATLLNIPTEEVRRIRQDARRRLSRQNL